MEADFFELMPSTVTVAPFQSADVRGKVTYGLPVSYPARIEIKDTFMRLRDGREVNAKGFVYLAVSSATGITTKDLLTLPANFEPTQPAVLDVMPEYDQLGIHHLKVVIG